MSEFMVLSGNTLYTLSYFVVAMSEMARTVYDQYIPLFSRVECVVWFAVWGVSSLVMLSRFDVCCHIGV
jgi:hypothetical protein